jgi:hypothetical protein
MIEQLEGQVSIFDLDGRYGKTCPERFRRTEATISGRSSKPSRKSQTPTLLYLDLRNRTDPDASWAEVGVLHGESSTRSIGESPSDAVESTLSQILQANAPEKYYLSAKACAGILRRAERRGKELPEMLKAALEETVSLG